jgi:hypothetical protein
MHPIQKEERGRKGKQKNSDVDDKILIWHDIAKLNIY